MHQKTKFCLAVLFIFSFITAHAGGTECPSHSPRQQMKNMMKNILDDNQRFREDPAHNDEYYKNLTEGQCPRATIIACADSRVQTINFDLDPVNDVFFIRNIGNQLETCLGSVDYGVNHLPSTALLVFIGHSKCGAVTAVTKGTDGLQDSIQSELSPMCVIHKTPNPTDEQIEENVRHNVRNQVNKAYHRYRERVESGSLWIVGGVYDFTPEGKGLFEVVQVNTHIDEEYINNFLEEIEN